MPTHTTPLLRRAEQTAGTITHPSTPVAVPLLSSVESIWCSERETRLSDSRTVSIVSPGRSLLGRWPLSAAASAQRAGAHGRQRNPGRRRRAAGSGWWRVAPLSGAMSPSTSSGRNSGCPCAGYPCTHLNSAARFQLCATNRLTPPGTGRQGRAQQGRALTGKRGGGGRRAGQRARLESKDVAPVEEPVHRARLRPGNVLKARRGPPGLDAVPVPGLAAAATEGPARGVRPPARRAESKPQRRPSTEGGYPDATLGPPVRTRGHTTSTACPSPGAFRGSPQSTAAPPGSRAPRYCRSRTRAGWRRRPRPGPAPPPGGRSRCPGRSGRAGGPRRSNP